MTTSQPSHNKSVFITLLAAAATAAASSLCCIGPLIYLVFGVSAAWASGIEKLGWLQVPMIVVSLGLIAFGFWRLHFSRKPYCAGRISRFQMLCLYWIAVPPILLLQFYPFVLPWVYEVFE